MKHIRKPVMLFKWMGMNALIIYALAACEMFTGALQGFYWGSPDNNLVTLISYMIFPHNFSTSFSVVGLLLHDYA